jgi:hypothetical protein
VPRFYTFFPLHSINDTDIEVMNVSEKRPFGNSPDRSRYNTMFENVPMLGGSFVFVYVKANHFAQCKKLPLLLRQCAQSLGESESIIQNELGYMIVKTRFADWRAITGLSSLTHKDLSIVLYCKMVCPIDKLLYKVDSFPADHSYNAEGGNEHRCDIQQPLSSTR